MVMYANEFKTKEKQKLTEMKNKLQHIQVLNNSEFHWNSESLTFKISMSFFINIIATKATTTDVTFVIQNVYRSKESKK